ncbi:hypothetical protein KOR42_50120 [Thalassoglobus neptunius]|uniref:Uncharacterized protein n=1 Tax=Thalassoglobus neptunius TaxID=1938619 RepID=A0A5C5VPK8_9PLAN|nr:hypothetical protein KOR42_50120 [Thalassoglobus neptunius]
MGANVIDRRCPGQKAIQRMHFHSAGNAGSRDGICNEPPGDNVVVGIVSGHLNLERSTDFEIKWACGINDRGGISGSRVSDCHGPGLDIKATAIIFNADCEFVITSRLDIPDQVTRRVVERGSVVLSHQRVDQGIAIRIVGIGVVFVRGSNRDGDRTENPFRATGPDEFRIKGIRSTVSCQSNVCNQITIFDAEIYDFDRSVRIGEDEVDW